MMHLCSEIVSSLSGKTVATAESCTGGMIGAALTAISGSSKVYKGGVISYTNEIKHNVLGVPLSLLDTCGAVSAEVAEAMASGARSVLGTDYAISVTGLAGPGGDEYGNPVGTVFIGYADENCCVSEHYVFKGDRESVRNQAAEKALALLLSKIKE